MLNRAIENILKTEEVYQKTDEPETKRVRYTPPATSKYAICFFCNKVAGHEGLHYASTFELDDRVRTCARLVEDNELLGRLSAGGVVALEAKYHTSYLVQLYNKARSFRSIESNLNNNEKSLHAYVFAELVMHIEEVREEKDTSSVFKLTDLADPYTSRLIELGVEIESRVHTTRLKQGILAHFPDMKAYTKGRDIILAFNEDIESFLLKSCKFDSDKDAVLLAHAAQIVRREIFIGNKTFSGFSNTYQKDSVPQLLLALVDMILDGPCINKDKIEDNQTAALTIAQLLKFNSVRHRSTRRKNATHRTVRHSSLLETPVPIYIWLMLHANTRKRELIGKLYSLGISFSYDRVLQLSTELGNKACQQFHQQKVVCPLDMKHGIFTSAAIDNIDHNTSSTTSKVSFHGTGISIIQHPSFQGAGVSQKIALTDEFLPACGGKVWRGIF